MTCSASLHPDLGEFLARMALGVRTALLPTHHAVIGQASGKKARAYLLAAMACTQEQAGHMCSQGAHNQVLSSKEKPIVCM